ncbi:MAG TPA: nucleotide exchange factor GrpE, partial [Planctomycetota bacterium]|nr:nucleotide exchange factor GrpE [Planctomycetota bacterium]
MNSNPRDPSNANESSAELEATSHDATGPESGPSGEGERRPAAGEERESTPAAALRALGDEELVAIEQRAGERDLYRDELLRARADLENYQKRVRRERPQWEDHAVRRLVADLLPVIDNFERALSARDESQGGDAFAEGVRLIHQMLLKALSDHGVEEIPALGESFDPELHEAVAVEETQEGRDHQIVDVQLKGYVHKGVVVR